MRLATLTMLPTLLLGGLPAQDSRPMRPTGPKPVAKPAKTAATAKSAAKPAVTMDELSRATLERWHRLEFHLGRKGIQTLTMNIAASSKSPLGTAKTTGVFQFDGTTATLTWKDPTLGQMFAARGWSQASFARWLRVDAFVKGLGKAKLTAKKAADGGVTIHIDGKTSSGYEALAFDAAGQLTTATLALPDATDGPKSTVVRYVFRPHGDQVLTSGWQFELTTPAGKLSAKTELSFANVQGHPVVAKVEETLTLDGKAIATQTLVFTDHKLSDKVAPKPKTAKPKTTPAQKNTPKPPKPTKPQPPTSRPTRIR